MLREYTPRGLVHDRWSTVKPVKLVVSLRHNWPRFERTDKTQVIHIWQTIYLCLVNLLTFHAMVLYVCQHLYFCHTVNDRFFCTNLYKWKSLYTFILWMYLLNTLSAISLWLVVNNPLNCALLAVHFTIGLLCVSFFTGQEYSQVSLSHALLTH